MKILIASLLVAAVVVAVPHQQRYGKPSYGGGQVVRAVPLGYSGTSPGQYAGPYRYGSGRQGALASNFISGGSSQGGFGQRFVGLGHQNSGRRVFSSGGSRNGQVQFGGSRGGRFFTGGKGSSHVFTTNERGRGGFVGGSNGRQLFFSGGSGRTRFSGRRLIGGFGRGSDEGFGRGSGEGFGRGSDEGFGRFGGFVRPGSSFGGSDESFRDDSGEGGFIFTRFRGGSDESFGDDFDESDGRGFRFSSQPQFLGPVTPFIAASASEEGRGDFLSAESQRGSSESLQSGAVACTNGLLLNALGECVLPRVTSNIFFYEGPKRLNQAPPVSVPQPELRKNVVLVNIPDEEEPEPILINRPYEETDIYVLKKNQDNQQQVVEVPSNPTKPQVYFVNYNHGDNFDLPAGISLQDAIRTGSTGDFAVGGNDGSGLISFGGNDGGDLISTGGNDGSAFLFGGFGSGEVSSGEDQSYEGSDSSEGSDSDEDSDSNSDEGSYENLGSLGGRLRLFNAGDAGSRSVFFSAGGRRSRERYSGYSSESDERGSRRGNNGGFGRVRFLNGGTTGLGKSQYRFYRVKQGSRAASGDLGDQAIIKGTRLASFGNRVSLGNTYGVPLNTNYNVPLQIVEDGPGEHTAGGTDGGDAGTAGDAVADYQDTQGSGGDAGGDYQDSQGSGVDAGGDYQDSQGSGGNVGGDYQDSQGSGGNVGGDYQDSQGSGGNVGGDYQDSQGSGGDAAGDYQDSQGSVGGSHDAPRSGYVPPSAHR